MVQMIELNCPAILKKFILLKQLDLQCVLVIRVVQQSDEATHVCSVFLTLFPVVLYHRAVTRALPDSRTSVFLPTPFSLFLQPPFSAFEPRLPASCPACLMATVSSDPILPFQILGYYLNLEFLIFAMYVTWKIKLSDYQSAREVFSKCLFLVTIIETFLCNRILTSWGTGMAVILIFFMMWLFQQRLKQVFVFLAEWTPVFGKNEDLRKMGLYRKW